MTPVSNWKPFNWKVRAHAIDPPGRISSTNGSKPVTPATIVLPDGVAATDCA